MAEIPELGELIESVREYLSAEVAATAADARARFRALVAAHVLEVASRELRGGEAMRVAQFERLRALIASNDPRAGGEPASASAIEPALRAAERELAEAIRSGATVVRPGDPVWCHVRESLVESLRPDGDLRVTRR